MKRDGYSLNDVMSLTCITNEPLTKLYHNDVRRTNINIVIKLCNLFKCDIGDLFVVVPPIEKGQKKEPLNKSGAAVGIKCLLSKLMERAGYSLVHVISRTGISRPSLSRLSYGNVGSQLNIEFTPKICSLFKCDISDLFVLVFAEEEN
jgi:DNA-binding Xre family transcriptional regulator